MHCTSWRSDGSPSCLGGSSHRWVPVNNHSTPVPLRREAVGGSAQTHNTRQRQTMSPDLYPLRLVYAIAGKHNRIMVAEQKIGTAWSNDCEPMRISPSMSAGILTIPVCTHAVRSDCCDCDSGFQEIDVNRSQVCENRDKLTHAEKSVFRPILV